MPDNKRHLTKNFGNDIELFFTTFRPKNYQKDSIAREHLSSVSTKNDCNGSFSMRSKNSSRKRDHWNFYLMTTALIVSSRYCHFRFAAGFLLAIYLEEYLAFMTIPFISQWRLFQMLRIYGSNAGILIVGKFYRRGGIDDRTETLSDSVLQALTANMLTLLALFMHKGITYYYSYFNY